MHKIMVGGIGTDVGKTVVSAILTTLLNGDYWKPVQCGNEINSDTSTVKNWLDNNHIVHPLTYIFKAPLSPHHAAKLENSTLCLKTITLPKTKRHLIIEGVGGIFVPLTAHILSIDLFKSWDCKWVIVSRHYLGSINHTLLTINALKQLKIPILGIVFNGEENVESESAILNISKLPFLARLDPEKNLNKKTIQRYAKKWQPQFLKLLL